MWSNKFPEKEGWYFIYHETPQFGCEIRVVHLKFEEYLGWRAELIGSDEQADARDFGKWQWHPIFEPPMP